MGSWNAIELVLAIFLGWMAIWGLWNFIPLCLTRGARAAFDRGHYRENDRFASALSMRSPLARRLALPWQCPNCSGSVRRFFEHLADPDQLAVRRHVYQCVHFCEGCRFFCADRIRAWTEDDGPSG